MAPDRRRAKRRGSSWRDEGAGRSCGADVRARRCEWAWCASEGKGSNVIPAALAHGSARRRASDGNEPAPITSISYPDAMDITQLILDDHHEQRRLFAILEQIDRGDGKALAAIWARLSAFLEVHAEAEERHFYPALLRVGTGAGGKPSADDETEDAIKDHNEIRDAVAAVAEHKVG